MARLSRQSISQADDLAAGAGDAQEAAADGPSQPAQKPAAMTQVSEKDAARARRQIERVLEQIDRLYPTLYQLTNTLQDLGVDLGQPLPENGGLCQLEDYGRAVIGLGKFLIAIGGGILLLSPPSPPTPSPKIGRGEATPAPSGGREKEESADG